MHIRYFRKDGEKRIEMLVFETPVIVLLPLFCTNCVTRASLPWTKKPAMKVVTEKDTAAVSEKASLLKNYYQIILKRLKDVHCRRM